MLSENLKDTGEILLNILTQPLSIPEAKKDINLLEAAKNFDPKNLQSSDLRKILLQFQELPQQTNIMLRELEILQNEL